VLDQSWRRYLEMGSLLAKGMVLDGILFDEGSDGRVQKMYCSVVLESRRIVGEMVDAGSQKDGRNS
jgi:hypothetical protein